MTTTPSVEALFPSQAPGLRWYQRLQLQYCTLSRECRWSWLGLVFTILYFTVVHYCTPLILRLLLHSVLVYSSIFVLAYGYAGFTLHQRLTKLESDASSSAFSDSSMMSSSYRRATVIRTKTIPKEAHPQIPQKVFCWLELHDENDARATIGEDEWMERLGHSMKEEENDEEDDKDWKHVPCVVAQELKPNSTEPRIQKGDRITVHPLDGDITRLIYVPYQRTALGRMKKSVLWSLVWAAGACVALALIFQDIPIILASSQQLQEVLNHFSNSFWDGFDDWLDKVLPDDDEEEDEDMNDDAIRGCRIPWFVGAAYDMILLMQAVLPVAVGLYVRWKVKRSMFEETPADSYQLLRGDESGDELAINNGLAFPSASGAGASSSAVVV